MFVIGEVSDRLRKAHQASLSIQQALVDMAKPGTECQALFHQAEQMAREQGLEEHFMGLGKDRVKFVGHGVGLELDELPVFANRATMKLEPGMTFALEPKFVFKEGAVGIENTYAMQGGRARVLSNAEEQIVCV